MNKEYVLLVWNQIPECTDFYLIPREFLLEGDRSRLLFLQNAHGKLNGESKLSSEEERALQYLSDATASKDEYVEEESEFKDKACELLKYKTEIDPGKLIHATIVEVCYSGVIL